MIRIQKAHEVEVQQSSRGNPEYVDRVKLLEKEVSYYKEESGKAQNEVERLLEILREVETEKNDKDKKIAELERWGPFFTFQCFWKGEVEHLSHIKHLDQLDWICFCILMILKTYLK